MFFTNRQNSASRINKRNKKKREKNVIVSLKARKERKEEGTCARERAFISEAISSDALNRMGEVYVIPLLYKSHEQITRIQKKTLDRLMGNITVGLDYTHRISETRFNEHVI